MYLNHLKILLMNSDIPVSQANLYQHVQYLTEIRPYRNYQNLEALNQAAYYIENQLKEYGYAPEAQTYQAKDNQYQNIIAQYGNQEGKRIVIGAHYDVDGDQPGADDNASAVAGLLEIARLLQILKPKLKHRVDLVAFSLEEAPFFYTEWMGSAVHAHSLKEQEIDVELMICLEMIGFFSDEPHSQKFPLPELASMYPHTANYICLVGRTEETQIVGDFKKQMLESANIDVQSICAPIELVSDITRSDHYNYWMNGYSALMVTDTSFLRNPNYHAITDTIETLDFERMTEVVRGTYAALAEIFGE
jgi:Zn-dependent M28 family amino/carboxypeptidase